MSVDSVNAIKNSHDSYYQNVEGPIGGMERFHWVMEAFFKKTSGKKILEIGCGEGSLLAQLKPSNEVYGVDISVSGVEKTARRGITCFHADASNENLPFEDNFFDVVITLETIEHVENPHRMIWEIKRVLKDQGTLLISIPGHKVYHPFIYPGLFSVENFSSFLQVNHFDIELIKGWGQAPLMDHWTRFALRDNKFWMKATAKLIYYLGRKRNMLMRNRLGTPLTYAFCLNFLCQNKKSLLTRVQEVALETTPSGGQ